MSRNSSKIRTLTGKVSQTMKPSVVLPINAIDRAKAAWPIYGGTTPTTDPPAAVTPEATPPAVDPLEELQKDPAKLQQLLSQVQTLTTQVSQLSTENTTFKDEKTKAERAQQTKEEQLQTDLQNKDILLAKAINIINEKVMENALLTHKDFQWHDSKDALRNIQENMSQIKVNVDIDKGIAEIEGMEAQVKDLAKRKPWLLKSAVGDPTGQPVGGQPLPPRGTGTPPAPPSTDAAKLARRNQLINKYPVIAQR